MKQTLMLLSAMILFFACSKKTIQTVTYDTKYLNYSSGVLKVRSDGYGTNKNEALLDAERYALKILFENGYPGSQQNTPLLNADERRRNENYINDFLGNNKFKPFITSTEAVSELTKVTGGKIKTKDGGKQSLPNQKIMADISINLTALRKHLEDNNIIRKFGY